MTFCEDPDDPYRVTQAVYQFVRGEYRWAHAMGNSGLLLEVRVTEAKRANFQQP